MVEVYPNIFVGDNYDFYDNEGDLEFNFCLCAKSFHQEFAKVQGDKGYGYDGKLSKSEPEYLIAERPEFNTLAVNLVDAPDVAYISKQVVERCLEYIESCVSKGRKVLIACDKGQSRSVGIAIMYGILNGRFLDCKTCDDVVNEFRKRYNNVCINKGMAEYVRRFWEDRKRGVEQ